MAKAPKKSDDKAATLLDGAPASPKIPASPIQNAADVKIVRLSLHTAALWAYRDGVSAGSIIDALEGELGAWREALANG